MLISVLILVCKRRKCNTAKLPPFLSDALLPEADVTITSALSHQVREKWAPRIWAQKIWHVDYVSEVAFVANAAFHWCWGLSGIVRRLTAVMMGKCMERVVAYETIASSNTFPGWILVCVCVWPQRGRCKRMCFILNVKKEKCNLSIYLVTRFHKSSRMMMCTLGFGMSFSYVWIKHAAKNFSSKKLWETVRGKKVIPDLTGNDNGQLSVRSIKLMLGKYFFFKGGWAGGHMKDGLCLWTLRCSSHELGLLCKDGRWLSLLFFFQCSHRVWSSWYFSDFVCVLRWDPAESDCTYLFYMFSLYSLMSKSEDNKWAKQTKQARNWQTC